MMLDKFNIVRTVARTGSFAKAAEELYISRSALSTTVGRIEQELGVALFRRTGSGAVLTDEGMEYLRYANTISRLWSELTENISAFASLQRGSVSLGSVGPIFHFVLLDLLQAFTARYPNIRVDIYDQSGNIVESNLASGEIELGLLHLPVETPGLHSEVVMREPMILVAPVGHPAAQAAERDPDSGQYYIDIKDVAEEKFVLTIEKFRDRRIMNQMFQQNGVAPHIAAELSRYDSIFPYIQATNTLTLGSYSVCRAYWKPGKVRFFYVKNCEEMNELALITLANSQLSHAAQAMKDVILQVIPTLYTDISQLE